LVPRRLKPEKQEMTTVLPAFEDNAIPPLILGHVQLDDMIVELLL
jgi:hypothetical protein